MNLLLLEAADFIAADRVRISDRRHEQLRKVLKAQPGKLCKAGRLGGLCGQAEVLAIDDESAELRVTLDTPPPPPSETVLAAALPRPQTFDKLLRCGTEMGIKRFDFFGCFKVEKSYWQSPVLLPEHVNYEFRLGLEQCGDTVLPEVFFHRCFKPFVEDELTGIAAGGRIFAGHPTAVEPPPVGMAGRKVLLLGPEGGFSDYEFELLKQHGVETVTLGRRILRTEHAAAVLLALLETRL